MGMTKKKSLQGLVPQQLAPVHGALGGEHGALRAQYD